MTLPSQPRCCHFNVVASSAAICFLVMCQREREVVWDQELYFSGFFYTAQFIFSRCRGGIKVEGRKRERGALLFLCGGSRWHTNEPWPPLLTHSLMYTHQYPHNLYHSLRYSSPFSHNFALFFSLVSTYTSSPDVWSSSLLSQQAESQPSTPATWQRQLITREALPWWKQQQACGSRCHDDS